tara:strand:+ start:2390 stop:3118 length:729 start_codon:yes stop_codon:yes gene_type:complete
MKSYLYLVSLFLLIFSCTDEKNETIDANLLIAPDFRFNDYLYECNIKEDSSLINLEVFLSSLIKDSFIRDEVSSLKVYFPKTNSFQKFIFHLQSAIDEDIYLDFLDTLSQKGLDKIAMCNFNSKIYKSFNEYSIDIQSSDIQFSEILRCEFNPGYSYGTFRLSMNKFLDEMKSLQMPYELIFLQEQQSSKKFTWINNFYTKNYSNDISGKWVDSKESNEIKDEFSKNAKCLESEAYKTFVII